MTLLYKTTSRHWTSVAHVNTSGHMTLQSDIFPNRRFGFNMRKLLVATILVSITMFILGAYILFRGEGDYFFSDQSMYFFCCTQQTTGIHSEHNTETIYM